MLYIMICKALLNIFTSAIKVDLLLYFIVIIIVVIIMIDSLKFRSF